MTGIGLRRGPLPSQLERRLRMSEANYRMVVELAADAIFAFDAQGRALDVNAAACRMLGYSREEFLQLSIGDIVALEERDRTSQQVAQLRAGDVVHSDHQFHRKDGTQLPVELGTTVLPDGRLLAIARNLTERKRAESALRDSEARLARMTGRLGTLQEKERRDMARELHDRVGQNLTALSFNLQQLRDAPEATDHARRKLADSQAIVEKTGNTITDILTELKPPMLANYGLLDALRFHAREFSRRTGLAVEADGREERFSAEIEMVLFRVAQAALNNVAQHAHAKSIRILIERDEARVRLEIADDGIGFDSEKALAAGRWGLTAMRERVEAIDGTLRIDSAPGRGTRIIVEVDIG